ncbi:MAG: hypothetical protein JST27_01795 [Bacteroidetes bacterium]|nr:hypothetical protein [Bacteroidota bacterium]
MAFFVSGFIPGNEKIEAYGLGMRKELREWTLIKESGAGWKMRFQVQFSAWQFFLLCPLPNKNAGDERQP